MYRFSIISDILPEQVSSSKTGIKNVPPPIPERNQENKVRLTKKNQKLKYTKFSTTCPTFLPFFKVCYADKETLLLFFKLGFQW